MKKVLTIKLWKTATYRLLSSAMSFLALYLATGQAKLSALLTAGELFWKPVLYYLHERAWLKTEQNAAKTGTTTAPDPTTTCQPLKPAFLRTD